jgi:hypothetical protein
MENIRELLDLLNRVEVKPSPLFAVGFTKASKALLRRVEDHITYLKNKDDESVKALEDTFSAFSIAVELLEGIHYGHLVPALSKGILSLGSDTLRYISQFNDFESSRRGLLVSKAFNKLWVCGMFFSVGMNITKGFLFFGDGNIQVPFDNVTESIFNRLSLAGSVSMHMTLDVTANQMILVQNCRIAFLFSRMTQLHALNVKVELRQFQMPVPFHMLLPNNCLEGLLVIELELSLELFLNASELRRMESNLCNVQRIHIRVLMGDSQAAAVQALGAFVKRRALKCDVHIDFRRMSEGSSADFPQCIEFQKVKKVSFDHCNMSYKHVLAFRWMQHLELIRVRFSGCLLLNYLASSCVLLKSLTIRDIDVRVGVPSSHYVFQFLRKVSMGPVQDWG